MYSKYSYSSNLKLSQLEATTKRKLEEEMAENMTPDNQHVDDVSDVSKGSTPTPKKKRAKTRNNASVTIEVEVITKLDKDNVQKLQRQRETLVAQGISGNYPLQNSTSPKLYDTIAQLLLLSDATEVEYDMDKEEDVKRFVVFLQKNEKIVVDLLVQ